jgi:hypothetical protein
MIIWINATVSAAMNHGERKAVHDHLERAAQHTWVGHGRGFELHCPVPTNLSYCQGV